MCHPQASLGLPPAAQAEQITEAGIAAYVFGQGNSRRSIVLIPDIYGVTPFYRGLATWYASAGACVFLLDPFAEVGELKEVSREAAFARRAKLRDRTYVDALEQFARQRQITGVVGFCLGGLYVFELARRRLPAALVSFYGFPQGLPNEDPLPVPFDYLEELSVEQVAMFGDTDYLQTPENFSRLKAISKVNPSFRLNLYSESGHGFLGDLDNENELLRANAKDALALSAQVLL